MHVCVVYIEKERNKYRGATTAGRRWMDAVYMGKSEHSRPEEELSNKLS